MSFEINVQDFIDEAEEQIRMLNDGLLALEKNKDDQEIINEVFRAAHTLKGGSGLVGFAKITELTHSIENIFDLIREKKFDLTSDHLDVMFEALDVLMELMSEVDSGAFNTDISAVSKKLKLILEANKVVKGKAKVAAQETPAAVVVEEPVAPPPTEKPVEKEQSKVTDSHFIAELMGREVTAEEEKHFKELREQGETVFCAHIVIGESCDVASLFMFMIFNKIIELGDFILSNPTEDVLEEEDSKEVSIFFTSIVSADVMEKELSMPEIETIQLTRLFENEEVASAPALPDIPVVEEIAPVIPVAKAPDVKATEASPVIPVEPVKEKELPPPVAKIPDPVIPPEPSKNAKEDAKEDIHEEKALVVKDVDSGRKSATLRVDSGKIDGLLNLAGELVINKARFVQIESDMAKVFGRNEKISELKDTVMQLMRITNELQEGIMQLRMVPIDQVFSKFPRVVRDIARKLDKKIDLIIEGKDTELDKSVVEEIGDPLMHLLRNSMDHGIERSSDRIAVGKNEVGAITLRAYHQGSSIVIEIEDDGAGIDLEKVKQKAISKGLVSEEEAALMPEKDAINLIFLPGFSTADVVSDLSGRGVGMDVVRKNVERLNGLVEISTERGKGSKFTIKLPLTLAIISTLLTKVTRFIYAIPLVNVIEIVEVSLKDISKIANKEAIRIRNEVINILRLNEVFALSSEDRDHERVQIVIVGAAHNRVGFVVDELIGEQEVVIKSLDNAMIESPGIAGASILGDGTVALIIDVNTLIDKVIQGIF